MNDKPGQRRGLGRGLGSLIPAAPPEGATTAPNPFDRPVGASAVPTREAVLAALPDDVSDESPDESATSVAGAYFREIPLDRLRPNPKQPRQVFDEEALDELVVSLREVGLLQPVIVRQLAGADAEFELVMGERRWRAAQRAGLQEIPAIVRQTEDTDLLRDALLENLHRAELNPLEEASAYAQLLEDFSCTHEELASRIGRSRPQISNTLRLLKLSPPVQRKVAAGVLSAGHARALLAVTDQELQDRLATRVVAEGISVRGLEEIVAMAEPSKQTRPKAAPAEPHPRASELATRLGDRFDTRVTVDVGKKKGKLVIEFATVDDLERIVAEMTGQPHSS